MDIPLINSARVAVVDDVDAPLVAPYAWWEHRVTDNLSYAYGTQLPRSPGRERVIKMHRLILGLKKGDSLVDHKDNNGLNNCRHNLQLITTAQNIQKAIFVPAKNPIKVHSKYRGVSYLGWHGKYLAYIDCNGKREYLGYFSDEEAAARARDKRALELHGEFARLNFENS